VKLEQLFIALISVFFIFSCAASDSSKNTVDGTYAKCTDNGNGTSMKVTIIFGSSGSTIVEDAVSYATSDCTGTGSSLFSFAGPQVMGALGQSTTYTGATDLVITPTTDPFSCGAGQPTYSWVVFASDYSSLKTPSASPGCSAGASPTTIDNVPYTRQ
jgi:hypothetical protein